MKRGEYIKMSKRYVSDHMLYLMTEWQVHQFRFKRAKQRLEIAKKTNDEAKIKLIKNELGDISSDVRALEREVYAEIDKYYK